MWLSGISWQTTVATWDTAMFVCLCVCVFLWAAELFIKHLRLTLRHLSLPLPLLLFLSVFVSCCFLQPFTFRFDFSVFFILISNSGKLLPVTASALIAVSLCQLPAAFINDATLLAHYECNCRPSAAAAAISLRCDAIQAKAETRRDDKVVNQSNHSITRWAHPI